MHRVPRPHGRLAATRFLITARSGRLAERGPALPGQRASVLHGLNDWNAINGHSAWVVVVVVSALLFLTYAKAGSADAATADADLGPTTARPSPAPATRETDPDRLLREFKKTLGHDN
jgi:hypothetical protein